MSLWSRVKRVVTRRKSSSGGSSSLPQSKSPVTVGGVTFGGGGKVTSKDPITQKTTTISTPTRSSGGGGSSPSGTSSSPTTVGNITFGDGEVTSTDPITQKTTTISKPQASTSATQISSKKSVSTPKTLIEQKVSDVGITPETAKIQPSKDEKTYLQKVTTRLKGEDPSNVPTYGQIVVTESEALKYGTGKRRPYYVVSSDSYPEMVREAQFGMSLPTVTGKSPSKGTFETDASIIYSGKKSFQAVRDIEKDFELNPESFRGQTGFKEIETGEGTTYSLEPSYFEEKLGKKDFSKGAVAYAKYQFGQLPTATKARLSFMSAGSSALSMIGGVGEYFATLPTAFVRGGTYDTETGTYGQASTLKVSGLSEIRKSSIPSPREFVGTSGFLSSPGGFVTERITDPSTATKIVGTTAALTVGGASFISRAKQVGAGEALADTVAGASPFKIKGGVYGEVVSPKTQFEGVSLKAGNTRLYTGTSARGTRIVSLENLGKTGSGIGQYVTSGRIIKISGGGSIVKMGTVTTGGTYGFAPSAGGAVSLVKTGSLGSTSFTVPNLGGGTTTVATGSRFTAYEFPKSLDIFATTNKLSLGTGGGMYTSQPGAEVRAFSSGRPVPTVKEGSINWRTLEGLGSKTVRVRPQLEGFEFDLGKIFGGGTTGFRGGISSSSFGGGGTSQIQTSSFQTPIQAPKITTATPPVSGTSGTINVIPVVTSTTRTRTTTLPSITSRTATTPKVTTRTVTTPRTEQVVSQIPSITSRTATTPKVTTRTVTTPKVSQSISQIPKTITKTVTASTFKSPTTPNFPRPSPSPIERFTPMPFKIPGFFGAGSFGGLGKIKASRRFREATSFGVARTKGFKVGEFSKQRFTGLEARDVLPKRKKKKERVPFSGLFKFRK